jgi:hypothetical protein
MALDRTWYNTLVDDDGSGLTGSVWDKTDVDSLMDAIDAEFARLIQARVVSGPILQSAESATIAVSLLSFESATLGDQVFYRLKINGAVVPATTAYLRIYPLPTVPIYTGDECMIRIYLGTSEWAYAVSHTAGYLELHRAADAAFAPGTYYINGSGFYFIR